MLDPRLDLYQTGLITLIVNDLSKIVMNNTYGSCKITLTGTTPGELNLDVIFGEVGSLHE